MKLKIEIENENEEVDELSKNGKWEETPSKDNWSWEQK